MDNHIQNVYLGRYIVGYTFGNHVLWLRLRVAVKLNYRPYIRRYTSPNENFEYSYPLSHTWKLGEFQISKSISKKLWLLCYLSVLTFVVGAQKNCLIEMVLLSIHNIWFNLINEKIKF